MKILLTGYEGYLGRILKERLMTHHSVYGYDIKSGYDINDPIRLESTILKIKPEIIIHLAGIVGDPNCALNISEAYQTNVMGTRNIIRLCKDYKIPLIFASTCSVYGKIDNEIVDEEGPQNPLSLYALTKQISENDIKESGIDYIIFRFGTLYGWSSHNSMRYDLVVNGMTKQASEDGKITVFGGDQRRPFLSIHECANIISKIVIKPKWGETYNLVSINLSINQLAKMIQSITKCYIKKETKITDQRDYAVINKKISSIYTIKPDLLEEIRKIWKNLISS